MWRAALIMHKNAGLCFYKSGYWASQSVYMVFYVIMWLIKNTRMGWNINCLL